MLICIVHFFAYILQLREDERNGNYQLWKIYKGFFSFLSSLIFFFCSVMVFKLDAVSGMDAKLASKENSDYYV